MLFRYFIKNTFSMPFHRVFFRNKRLVSVKRYPQCEVSKISGPFSKVFCFTFLNLIHVAYAEPQSNYEKQKESSGTPESAILESDEFFLMGKFEDSWKVLLPYKDSNNVEVLWRISRALYNQAKKKNVQKSENASLILEAYKYIEKALTLDKNNFSVHKWMAILFDAKSALEGMKARISALPVFKEHLMIAIELNPKDATSIYMLGQYMYSIANMSWLQKTIAKALFGTPPEATFEEAFYYFSKAEEVEPNFYSANLLMLGKTCLKLKKIEAARYWLKCAIAYPVRTDEDEAVRLEAEELLNKNPAVKPETKKSEESEKL